MICVKAGLDHYIEKDFPAWFITIRRGKESQAESYLSREDASGPGSTHRFMVFNYPKLVGSTVSKGGHISTSSFIIYTEFKIHYTKERQCRIIDGNILIS